MSMGFLIQLSTFYVELLIPCSLRSLVLGDEGGRRPIRLLKYGRVTGSWKISAAWGSRVQQSSFSVP